MGYAQIIPASMLDRCDSCDQLKVGAEGRSIYANDQEVIWFCKSCAEMYTN